MLWKKAVINILRTFLNMTQNFDLMTVFQYLLSDIATSTTWSILPKDVETIFFSFLTLIRLFVDVFSVTSTSSRSRFFWPSFWSRLFGHVFSQPTSLTFRYLHLFLEKVTNYIFSELFSKALENFGY